MRGTAIKKSIATVSVCLFMLLSASGQNMNLFRLKTSDKPVIDGVLETVWDDMGWNPVARTVMGGREGIADISASYKATYDGQAVYLAVKVKDTYIQNASGSMFYFENDAINLFFDFGGEGQGFLDGNDLQLSAVYGDAAVYSREGLPTGAILTGWGQGDGEYTLEMAIPFEAIGQTAPSAGSRWGFDLLVNDFDEEGYRECVMGWNGDERDYSGCSELGSWMVCEEREFSVFEAENASIDGLKDMNLRGDAYVQTIDATDGKLTFNLGYLETGTYYVWVKARGDDSQSGSFRVDFDNDNDRDRATAVLFAPNGSFVWVTPKQRTLRVVTGGMHTATIFSACAFVDIDKILVTNNPELVPVTLDDPANTNVSAAGGKAVVSWEMAGNAADTIVIERKRNSERAFEEIARVTGNSTSFIDQDAILEEGLAYRLKAISEYDASAYGKTGRLSYVLPGAPKSLTVDSKSERDTLRWEPSDGKAIGYSVEARIGNSEYFEIKRLYGWAREYSWNESKQKRQYGISYRVRAYNAFGYSGYAYAVTETDLISNVEYSSGATDIYISHDFCTWQRMYCTRFRWDEFRFLFMYENALYQDRPKFKNEYLFSSVPSYLRGTEYLRAFAGESDVEDERYASFVAKKNLRLYLAADNGANVDCDEWTLVEKGVSINPSQYPHGVDIYKRSVFKGSVVSLAPNRQLTQSGNQFLLFFEEDPSANIQVNFAPSRSAPIEDYAHDVGEAFATHADGLSYGWRKDASRHAVDRNVFQDSLTDSFIEIPLGNAWEVYLPDGLYRVEVCLGDDWLPGTEELLVNGQSFKLSDDSRIMRKVSNHVTVSTDVVVSGTCGSRLTLERGNSTAKLNFVHIQRLSAHERAYQPEGDTYIDANDARAINGNSPYVNVSERDKNKYSESIGLVSFDIPVYRSPVESYLEVYLRQLLAENPDGGSISVYGVDDYAFDETTLNWNGCPLVSVEKRRGTVSLSDRAEYLGEMTVSSDGITCRFDVTNFIAGRSSRTVTFLLVGKEHGRLAATFYSKEKGINAPQLRVVSAKNLVNLEGYLSSRESGSFTLDMSDLRRYTLRSPYVDLSAYANENVLVRGYIDPDYEAVTGEGTCVVVESIQVIPPPGPPMLTVKPWDNTGFPVWEWNVPIGATQYRYRLDGGAWLEGETTSYTPASKLAEGRHELELECRNRSSQWTAPVRAAVTVDVTPPQIIDMEYVTPTNVQHPPFAWNSSDNLTETEQLLYQYRIDGAEWLTSISEKYSPAYALEEGFRTFQIKVRDLAGNWSEVALYPLEIDLTAPAETSDIRVFYSEDGARVLWDDSISPDVNRYVITREPAMPYPVTVQPGIEEFLDISAHMVNDRLYTYTIKVIDDATNVSEGSEASDGFSGIVSPSTEVQVVDGNEIKVFFAPGTVDETVNVLIKHVDAPIASKPGVRQIGPVYHLEPHGIEFNAPVMLYFTYTDDQIANIEDEQYLSVDYFDPVKLTWVKIPSTVDAVNNVVVAFTNHFSEYSLRVDTSSAYEGEGINPFGEYYTNLNEAVGESGGDLNVSINLAKLPGVRGNDLSLSLLYSSNAEMGATDSAIFRTISQIYKELNVCYENGYGNVDSIINKPILSKLPIKDFELGNGWSLDIPHVLNSTVYLPGGSGYALKLNQEVHSGIHYSSKRDGNNILLTTVSGYTYVFDGTSYFSKTAAELGEKDWVYEYYQKLEQFNQSNGITSVELETAYKNAFNAWTNTNAEWESTTTNKIARLVSVTDPFGNATTYSYGDDFIEISSTAGKIAYSCPKATPDTMTITANGIVVATIVKEGGALKYLRQNTKSAEYLQTSFSYADVDASFDFTYYTLSGTKTEKQRTAKATILSRIDYPSRAYTVYSGTAKEEDNQHKYRYYTQTVFDKDGATKKKVEYLYEGGFRQVSKSATTVKNADGSIARQTQKYYNISGNMYRDITDGKVVDYDYYYEPLNAERATLSLTERGFGLGSLKYAIENSIFKNVGQVQSTSPIVIEKPGSGVPVGNDVILMPGASLPIAGSGPKFSVCDVAATIPISGLLPDGLMLDLIGVSDLYFVAGTNGKVFVFHGIPAKLEDALLTVSGEDVSSSVSGYIWSDPVNTLIEDYNGYDITLVLKGDKTFELVCARLDQEERASRSRVRSKTVQDVGLKFMEWFGYDGWGNTTYFQAGDGHQVFKSFDQTYRDMQTVNLESMNTKLYADANALVADGNYKKTTWAYSAKHAPDSITEINGGENRVKTFLYNADGTVSRIIAPNGGITDFVYEQSRKLLLKQTEKGVAPASPGQLPYSDDIVTAYAYDALNRLSSETIGGERVTSYDYDLTGRITKITYPDGSGKIQYYDDSTSSAIIATVAAGGQYAATDLTSDAFPSSSPLWNKVRYQYDGLSGIVSLTKYLKGQSSAYYSISFAHNALGDVVSTSDSGSRTTSRRYDGRGRLVTLIREDASEVSIEYDNTLQITKYTDEEGYISKVQKNLNGLVEKIWMQTSRETPDLFYGTQYTYDGTGNKTRTVTGAAYNASGAALDIPGASPDAYDYAYNAFAEITSQTNPSRNAVNPENGESAENAVVRTDYAVSLSKGVTERSVSYPNGIAFGGSQSATTWEDSRSNVLKAKTPLGYETRNAYDKFGQLVQSMDAEGNSTYYSYTSRGLVETTRDDDGRYVKCEYDPLGNVIRKGYGLYDSETETYAESYYESFTYDSLSRPVKQVFPDKTYAENTSIDVYGNVRESRDRSGLLTRYTYDDKRDFLLSVTSPSGVTVSYAYNKRGEKTSETDGNGNSSRYEYDGIGHVTRFDNRAGLSIALAYDNHGRTASRSEGIAGVEQKNITRFTYLPGTELASSVTIHGDGRAQELQSLSYDANGNLCVDDRNGAVRYYRYDRDNRLVREIDSADTAVSIQYEYYSNSLLRKKTERSGKTATYAYTRANLPWQVVNADGDELQTTTYDHDFMGRVTTVERTGLDPFVKHYEYDHPTGNLKDERFSADGASFSTGYGYTAGGLLSEILYPGSSKKLSYAYDGSGRLSGVRGITEAAGFTYQDKIGQLESIALSGGTRIEYGYDSAYRMTDVSYSAGKGLDPIWSLENEIDAYGNVTAQRIGGSYVSAAFGAEEARTTTFGYDFMNRLTSYSTAYEARFALTESPDRTTSISRDFESGDGTDRDAEFYESLPEETAESMPGMDYYQDGDTSLILYYSSIRKSDDPVTQREDFALDGEGSSLTIDMGSTRTGITGFNLYPKHYEREGQTVTREGDYAKLLDRFNDFNLVVKYRIPGSGYATIENEQVALKNGNASNRWTLIKDTKTGTLRIRFRDPIEADSIKVYSLIDDRVPVLYSDDEPDAAGLIMNPVARESSGYFGNSGMFVNSATFMANVEYALDSRLAVTYSYDENGNRVRKESVYGDSGETENRDYSYYPSSNRLKSDGEYAYEYDADGNLSRRYNEYVEYAYEWNPQNRLEKVYLRQFRLGWNADWEKNLTEDEARALRDEFLLIFEAKYDESSQRYWKRARQSDASVVETRYAYTSAGLLYEESSVAGTLVKKSYVYAAGQKLAEVSGSLDVAHDADGVVTDFPADMVRFSVCDQLGSTRLLADGTGSVLWYGEYAPFGESSYESAGADGTSTNQTFTSYTRDMEIGLQYAMNRYYIPELGRFISEDPVKDGLNWYVYCANNPLRFVDPSGLDYNGMPSDVQNMLEDRGDLPKSNPKSTNFAPGDQDSSGSGSGSGSGESKIPELKSPDLRELLSNIWDGDDNDALRQLFDDLKEGGTDALAGALNDYFINKRDYNVSKLKKSFDNNILDVAAVEEVIYYQLLEVLCPDDIYELQKVVLTAYYLGFVPWDDIANASSQVTRDVLQKLGKIADDTYNGGKVGPGVWRVDTAAMSDEARAWQGLDAYRVPWKTKSSANMRDYVDFDGWDSVTSQLIDRKLNVTGFQKSVDQAQRQAALAQQYGLTVRWEVPANRLQAAQSLLNKAGVGNTISVIVP